MSEEELNKRYIQEKTGLVDDDELIPIILDMLSEVYINGLEQSKFDKRMLELENQQLKEQLEKTIKYLYQDGNITLYGKIKLLGLLKGDKE